MDLYVMKKKDAEAFWTRAGTWGKPYEAQVFEEAPDCNNATPLHLTDKDLRGVLTSDMVLETTYVPQTPEPCPRHNLPMFKWSVKLTLRSGLTLYEGPYSMGSAHVEGTFPETTERGAFVLAIWSSVVELYGKGRVMWSPLKRDLPLQQCRAAPPKLLDVLCSILLDADAINYASFEDWADDYGYNTDSREAEATYRQYLEVAARLGYALGLRVHDLRLAFQDY